MKKVLICVSICILLTVLFFLLLYGFFAYWRLA